MAGKRIKTFEKEFAKGTVEKMSREAKVTDLAWQTAAGVVTDEAILETYQLPPTKDGVNAVIVVFKAAVDPEKVRPLFDAFAAASGPSLDTTFTLQALLPEMEISADDAKGAVAYKATFTPKPLEAKDEKADKEVDKASMKETMDAATSAAS